MEPSNLSDDQRHLRLAASAPSSLAEKMVDTQLSGERRTVTALFADIVGSTSLMENIDPEDWATLVNVAFDLMSQAVFRYEGTIAQLQGDAMVAFFGAPVAHEDDPERAIRSALDMLSEVQEYRQHLKKTQGIEFQIRAGINTGLVLVGKVGTDLRYEYTALGDAMNVAARMEAAARPGTVLITHDTYRLVSGAFDVNDLGAIAVKGKSVPVHAYEVVGPRAVSTPARGIAGLHSPMVGRDAYLEVLESEFEIVRSGRGRIATIIGEPGIGKTRLMREFKAWVLSTAGDVRWTEGQSLSYGRNFPYHVVMNLVRSCLDVTPYSSKEETGDALDATLSSLTEEERTSARAALAHLLSLPISSKQEEFFSSMDPEQLQKRYLGGLRLLVNAVASTGPLVMVLEDMHWSDAASAQLLTWMLALGMTLPILICITSRPDTDTPGWQLIDAAQQVARGDLAELRLEPLEASASSQMMAALLEIESLPPKLRKSLLGKAEGNPFFLEELIRALIDQGAIERKGQKWVATDEVQSAQVPGTIRGLLLSRIDRLEDEIQHSLKVASVIGRQFPESVLAKVRGDSTNLRRELDQLEDSGLVRLAAVHPEREYAFQHSMIQETAYESLLKRERGRLHLLVGQSIEELYPDRTEEMAPDLGLHFEEAGDERALGYLSTAALSAQQRYAAREARAFFDRAWRLLPDSSDEASIRTRVEVAVGRVEVGWTFSAPSDEVDSLESVVDQAESLGDDSLLIRMYSLIAMLRQFQGEQYGVSPELTRAMDRADQLGKTTEDPSVRAGPLTQMGWALMMSGSHRRGLALLEETIPLLQRKGRLIDLGINMDGLAFEYNRLGEIKLSDMWLERAEELAEQGDPIARLDFLTAKAGIMFFRNDLDAAFETAHLCATQSDEMGIISCSIGSHLALGMVYLMRGQPELALSNLDRGVELSKVSLKFWLPLIASARGTAQAMLGRTEEAKAEWQDSLDRARAMHDLFVEALVLYFRGWVMSVLPNPNWDSVFSDFEESVKLFEKQEMKLFVARTLKDYGLALKTSGRREASQEKFARALELYEEMELSSEAKAVRAMQAA